MLPAEFEPTVSASERPQIQNLDHVTTGIGMHQLLVFTKLMAQNIFCIWIVSFFNQGTVSLLKGQFFVTHTIRQSDIHSLLDS
jgi:hypothetical protein